MSTHMPPPLDQLDARYWWHIKEMTFAQHANANQQVKFQEELKAVHPEVMKICRRTHRRFVTKEEHMWVFTHVWDEYANWYTAQHGDWDYAAFSKVAIQSPNSFQWGISQYNREDYTDISSAETAFWWGHQQEMALWLVAFYRNTTSPNVVWECRFCGEHKEGEDLEHFLVCDKEECQVLAILDGDMVTAKGVEI